MAIKQSIFVSGTKQWVFQRICNISVIIYAVAMILYWLTESPVDYQTWHTLHQTLWFQLLSSWAITAAALGGWLAGWQIVGDYIQGSLRKVVNVLSGMLNSLLWLFAFYIIWS